MWQPLGVSVGGLVLLAWVAREAVDRNGGYFSNSEFRAWLVVMGVVVGGCLVAGVLLARRPIGRGILLGTVLASLLIGAALMAEVLINSS